MKAGPPPRKALQPDRSAVRGKVGQDGEDRPDRKDPQAIGRIEGEAQGQGGVAYEATGRDKGDQALDLGHQARSSYQPREEA